MEGRFSFYATTLRSIILTYEHIHEHRIRPTESFIKETNFMVTQSSLSLTKTMVTENVNCILYTVSVYCTAVL